MNQIYPATPLPELTADPTPVPGAVLLFARQDGYAYVLNDAGEKFRLEPVGEGGGGESPAGTNLLEVHIPPNSMVPPATYAKAADLDNYFLLDGSRPIIGLATFLSTVNIAEWVNSSGTLQAAITAAGQLQLINVPTSDPSEAGVVWSDGGTLKISAGA